MRVYLAALWLVISAAPNESFLHGKTLRRPPAVTTTTGRKTEHFGSNSKEEEEPPRDFAFSRQDPPSIDNSGESSDKTSPSQQESQLPSVSRSRITEPFQVVLGGVDGESARLDATSPLPEEETVPASNPNIQELTTGGCRINFENPINVEAFPDQGSRQGGPSISFKKKQKVDPSLIDDFISAETKDETKPEVPQQQTKERTVTAEELAYQRGLEAKQRQLEMREKAQLEKSLREEARLEVLALAAKRRQEDARRKEQQQRKDEERMQQPGKKYTNKPEENYGSTDLFRKSLEPEEVKLQDEHKPKGHMEEVLYQRQLQLEEAKARAAAKRAEEDREATEKARRRGEELQRLKEEREQHASTQADTLAYQRHLRLKEAKAHAAAKLAEEEREAIENAKRRGEELRRIREEQEKLASTNTISAETLAYQRQLQMKEAKARAAAQVAEIEREAIEKAKRRGEELQRLQEARKKEASMKADQLAYQRQMQLEEAKARAAEKLAEVERQAIEAAKRRGQELQRVQHARNNQTSTKADVLAYQRHLGFEEAKARAAAKIAAGEREMIEKAKRRGEELQRIQEGQELSVATKADSGELSVNQRHTQYQEAKPLDVLSESTKEEHEPLGKAEQKSDKPKLEADNVQNSAHERQMHLEKVKAQAAAERAQEEREAIENINRRLEELQRLREDRKK